VTVTSVRLASGRTTSPQSKSPPIAEKGGEAPVWRTARMTRGETMSRLGNRPSMSVHMCNRASLLSGQSQSGIVKDVIVASRTPTSSSMSYSDELFGRSLNSVWKARVFSYSHADQTHRGSLDRLHKGCQLGMSPKESRERDEPPNYINLLML
jgi:hypothetical protein